MEFLRRFFSKSSQPLESQVGKNDSASVVESNCLVEHSSMSEEEVENEIKKIERELESLIEIKMSSIRANPRMDILSDAKYTTPDGRIEISFEKYTFLEDTHRLSVVYRRDGHIVARISFRLNMSGAPAYRRSLREDKIVRSTTLVLGDHASAFYCEFDVKRKPLGAQLSIWKKVNRHLQSNGHLFEKLFSQIRTERDSLEDFFDIINGHDK